MSPVAWATRPQDATVSDTGQGKAGFACRTILLNDDVHTFDEVARQVARAIRCSFDRGMAIAMNVHNKGSEVVYTGPLERCEAVASVLEEIRLSVRIDR